MNDYLNNIPLSNMKTPCNGYKDVCTLAEWKTLNLDLWKQSFEVLMNKALKINNHYSFGHLKYRIQNLLIY